MMLTSALSEAGHDNIIIYDMPSWSSKVQMSGRGFRCLSGHYAFNRVGLKTVYDEDT